MRHHLSTLLALFAVAAARTVFADEPNLGKYVPPAENKKDEPLAKQFSFAKAVSFLDNAALDWQKKRDCFSCHTNYAFLYVRPMVDAKVQAHGEIRTALESLVTKRWPAKKPRWDAEVVATAAALAYNDSLTTKKLHPVTKTALDRIWTVQQKDGGIKWLKCAWPPMENDDHYGVTLALLAVGVAPEGYAKTPQAQKGVAGLLRWLKANPPENSHHQAMLLWASIHLDGVQTKAQQQAAIKELLAKQLPDGGWSASSLGNWKRGDKTEQALNTSDGYGTGFTVFLLRQAGVPASDPAIAKGVSWLKSNQRESGRWFTRSLFKDNKHYLTHVGTAFAVMALQSCDTPAVSAGR